MVARISKKTTLPDPDSREVRLFAKLHDALPRFRQKPWRRVLKNETFIAVAQAIYAGKNTAIDLDHTLYQTDATYALIHLGKFLDIFKGDHTAHFQKSYQQYYFPNQKRSKIKDYQAERDFYRSLVQLFTGLKFTKTQQLAKQLWFTGFPEFAFPEPLFSLLYPEMAYLVALGMEGEGQGKHFSFITASPNFAISPLVDFFGLPPNNLASFDPIVRNNIITRDIERMTFGKGKVVAARKIFDGLHDIAIGDSPTNDWELLRQAKLFAMGVGDRMRALDGTPLARNRHLRYVPFLAATKNKKLFAAPPSNL